MKNSVIMKREIGGLITPQRTGDSYFEINNLTKQWNSISGNTVKHVADFFENSGTQEFMEELSSELYERNLREGIPSLKHFQLVKKIKAQPLLGKGSIAGEVWVHPYLFVKYAMWLDVKYEVQVVMAVYDHMIPLRCLAGDFHRVMCKAIASIVEPNYVQRAAIMTTVACNYTVFNEHLRRVRNNYGTEEKQRELYKLEENIALFIEEGFIENFEDLIVHLQKKYLNKWGLPVPFTFSLKSNNEEES
jgi:hypothetical protein